MADQVPGGMLERTHGFAGARFFDAFTQHPERRAAFIGFASEATVGPLRGNQVAFRDVVVEEYRGQVGGTPFIEPDLCHFIPIGIADAFIEAYAPADYVEAVNEVALPRYAKSEEMQFGKGVLLEFSAERLALVHRTARLVHLAGDALPAADGHRRDRSSASTRDRGQDARHAGRTPRRELIAARRARRHAQARGPPQSKAAIGGRRAQNALGSPACAKMPFAVVVFLMVRGTLNVRPVTGLYQIS